MLHWATKGRLELQIVVFQMTLHFASWLSKVQRGWYEPKTTITVHVPHMLNGNTLWCGRLHTAPSAYFLGQPNCTMQYWCVKEMAFTRATFFFFCKKWSGTANNEQAKSYFRLRLGGTCRSTKLVVPMVAFGGYIYMLETSWCLQKQAWASTRFIWSIQPVCWG